MCFTPKIKLRNLRWVPNSIATRFPSAHGVGLKHCPIQHLWRAVSQGGSAVLAALSKEKVSTDICSTQCRERAKQERKPGWNTAGQWEVFEVTLYHCHFHPKEWVEPRCRRAHYPTLQRGFMLNIWKRNERRGGTGSIPQGTHLPRMPNLCRPLRTHLCSPHSFPGRRSAGCRGPLPSPISAHLSTCVDAEQGHTKHREKQLSLQKNPYPPAQSSFQCSSPM